MIDVKIAATRQETPTVRSFDLDTLGQPFKFEPGQWIDCYATINGKTEVAGYSMTSSPTVEGIFSIAVKRVGDNAVTDYLHENASLGHTLRVEGGQGDFYYQPAMGNSLTLIAGGIGITPLMSMLRFVDTALPEARLTLLYSASSPDELVFGDEIVSIAARNSNIRAYFTVTGPSGDEWTGMKGRIDGPKLESAAVDTDGLFFVCGPPAMIQDVTALVRGMDVPESRIRYEQWW